MSELPWQAALALYSCEKPAPMGWPSATACILVIGTICFTVCLICWRNTR